MFGVKREGRRTSIRNGIEVECVGPPLLIERRRDELHFFRPATESFAHLFPSFHKKNPFSVEAKGFGKYETGADTCCSGPNNEYIDVCRCHLSGWIGRGQILEKCCDFRHLVCGLVVLRIQFVGELEGIPNFTKKLQGWFFARFSHFVHRICHQCHRLQESGFGHGGNSRLYFIDNLLGLGSGTSIILLFHQLLNIVDELVVIFSFFRFHLLKFLNDDTMM
mmetsp:Transcript_21570/g.51479  ORF Transcript_21570/g.51479 Transcript_21570/m.51479 type:complete len:221 (+) Transcript_21570:1363-2025(+)